MGAMANGELTQKYITYMPGRCKNESRELSRVVTGYIVQALHAQNKRN